VIRGPIELPVFLETTSSWFLGSAWGDLRSRYVPKDPKHRRQGSRTRTNLIEPK
jgi:hypothetical protein